MADAADLKSAAFGRAGSSPAIGSSVVQFMSQNSSASQPATTPEETVSSGVLSSDLQPRLWLASASPRRAQLLQTIGVPFQLLANHADEPEPNAQDHAHPQNYVEALAHSKAASCEFPPADNTHFDIVLSADTVVWHDGQILNKPRDEAQARQMLGKLVGQRHQVLTGVCLRWRENNEARFLISHERTTVQFAHRDAAWVARYVASGEPMDKAGAYAAQGLGALLIERIDGDFWNVVGLPLYRTGQMLRQLGVALENWWPND